MGVHYLLRSWDIEYACQPDVISMWHALRESDYDLGIDIDKMREAEEVFRDCMEDYFMPPEATATSPLIPFSPMPGGALTANTQMMRDNGILNRYDDIIRAMGEVVKLGGYGTSVTPVSQFYFQQAFNNVMIGPWEKIAEGYGKMVLGYFGKTPLPADPKIVKIASEQLGLEPTTKSVLEINDADTSKGIEAAKALLDKEGIEKTDENIFIAATCKEKGITFLKGEAKTGVRKVEKKAEGGAAEGGYTVTLNNKKYAVEIKGNDAIVNGKKYAVDVKEGIEKNSDTSASGAVHKAESQDTISIKAPLPGTVLRIVANELDAVHAGDTILVIEAMKMETEIKASSNGTVSSILVSVGDQVTAGQELATLN